MAEKFRVVLEAGPKGSKVAAVAADWPGLERGAKTEEAAIEVLNSYRPRYVRVAELAGQEQQFAAAGAVDVVERYRGTGSTDFWGISFAFSAIDRDELSRSELERELTLMRACWAFFDEVRGRVSAEMRKGPRGGGRDRDRIVLHTLAAEQDWGKKLGVRSPDGVIITDPEELQQFRSQFCAAVRTFHAEGKLARSWPLRFLIRHVAYHTLDHTWEMEDKDLTA